MYYRRKILLALLEAFGGSLKNTDCQKLLFLFCSRREKNYYDFFPHKYGNYSLILAQDKDRLTDLGFLTSHSDFQLKDDRPYIELLTSKDRAILHALVLEIGDLRGKALIHKTYIEAPHYVSRSQIATQILQDTEYKKASSTWNKAQTPCLFTVGYEGVSIDTYLDLLISNNISTLVDVRKNPISMKYGFSKARLASYTTLAGISYVHIPELGIPSHLRKNLGNAASYQTLFDFYSSHILPDHLDALKQLKNIITENGRVAITCFEADPHFCHRHKVTEYLANDPDFHTPIEHLHKVSCNTVDKSNKTQQNGLWDKNALYSSI
ncbi:MAG TPA: DUF488 family protein [Dictyobacter sp.]|jgi:uncharacterized protein (DUF488 family)|nr:DUF488 family protein [Dictyobacter sp.]